jgi:hypothetical protein
MVSWLKRHGNKLLIMTVMAISLVAWYWSYSRGWVLAYNDARSHLDMARLVVDNQKPGFVQMGSVWLPLSHVLTLPLVWIKWAWQTGFAGSIVSMLAFVFTAAGLYAIVMQLTGRRLAAVLASAAAVLNVNMLYLQTTPLTEPLYVALFIWSVYFLIRYVKTTEVKYLLPLAFLASLQIMARYDGWFVAVCIGIILWLFEVGYRRLPLKKAFGNLLVYMTPVVFAMLLWIGWNAVIFGDPTYFLTGPFSAHAQQDVVNQQAGLITKGNMLVSLRAMGFSVADNVGWLVLNIALVGWLLYLNPRSTRDGAVRIVVLAVLMSVVVFNVLALYLGFSALNVPELNWNPSGSLSGSLFNARYGILALPFVAVGVGLLAAQFKKMSRYYAIPLVTILIVGQSFITYADTPITLQDGQTGSSAFVEQAVADQLRVTVGPQDRVLMSMFSFNPVAHASALNLKQFVHEGATKQWEDALDAPERHVQWIVMPNNDYSSDPIYHELAQAHPETLQRYYTLEYQDQYARVYHLTNHTALK